MSSISGRISSARLIRIRNQSSKNVLKETSSLSIIKESSQKIEKEKEECKDFFSMLTNDKIHEQSVKIVARKTKLAQKNRQKSKTSSEGRLKNGRLTYDKLDEDTDDEENYEEDLRLVDGNALPFTYGSVPSELLGEPLMELDPYIKIRFLTFLVLARRLNRFSINRFSSAKSLFIFSPFNVIRRVCLAAVTSQFFDFFMILAILSNCIVLAIPLTNEQSNINEYIFTSIYTIEMILKIIAKGFILNPYTYLRDPWNWLDFGVVFLTYVSIALTSLGIEEAKTLKLFRVFRAFKTINIIPGLKMIVTAIFKSLKSFAEVLVLMIIFMLIFSLYGLHAFKGSFGQKCVRNYDLAFGINYEDWIRNESNWLVDPFIGDYMLCSNASMPTNEGRLCASEVYCKLSNGTTCFNYTCLRVGSNPDDDFTHFDNIWHSMMLLFQIICLDNWENISDKIIETQGPWNVVFIWPIIFIGSFFLINLMLAVVALAYEIESENAKKLVETPVDNQSSKKALVFNLSKLQEVISESKDNFQEDNGKQMTTFKSIVNSFVISNRLTKAQPDTRQGTFTNNVGDLCVDHNSKISQIKLSSELGILNAYVDEGLSSCKLPDEKLVDSRNFTWCLSFGIIYYRWIQFENLLLKLVQSLYFELLISFCIVLNTIIMAIQYDGQPKEIDDLQDYSNFIISSIFILETMLKIIAHGKLYFLDSSSWFDLAITLLTIIDFSLPNVQGLSVFRAFRLIKIAKSWKAMRKIVVIIIKSLKSISYLSLVLFLILYMFAIIGIDLFQSNYQKVYASPNNTKYTLAFYGVRASNHMPRSNFDNIWQSLMTILRIICGESAYPLQECWITSGPLCLVLFYPTTIFGNFIILNLFLAMLLSAFDGDSTKSDGEEEMTKSEEQFKKLKEKLFNCFNEKIKSILNTDENALEDMSKQKEEVQPCFPSFLSDRLKCLAKDANTPLMKKWTKLRSVTLKVVDHKIFETFIILTIILSSILLCFDDVYLKNGSELFNTLQIIDYVIQGIFLIEMLLKWLAYGLKKYFSDWWCLLDVFIVFISMLNLILSFQSNATNLSYLKVLRTLRAFRPLKAISRLKEMKIVINALGNSIPEIINVLIVCLIFWLIFSIMGVQLFKGKFYSCYASNGSLLENYQIKSKNDCLSLNGTQWYNQKINFDNVLNGYLALLHIATFSGWQQIIQCGVDSTSKDLQPQRESNPLAYAYFIVFIIFGGFVTLNLFIGVLIDNFNTLKKKYESKESNMSFTSVLLTENQKKYVETIKSLLKLKPKKAITKPQNAFLLYFHEIVFDSLFDLTILLIIILNVIILSIEHYGQTEYQKAIVSILNTIFIAIYTLEILIKLIACKFVHFFRVYWNVFDLIVTLLSIINVQFEETLDEFIILPNTFRLLRVLRLGDILRNVSFAKGIRKILYSLLISVPALLNIGSLLFLIIFIYSILGMNLFLNVQFKYFTPTKNFQTFVKSFLLLFRVGTISGWDDLLQQLMLQSSDPNSNGSCDDSFDLQSIDNSYDPILAKGCGSPYFAIPFLVSYIFIVRLILLNMFIAITLESYNQVYRQDEIGINDEDIKNFYIKWSAYDPYSTQFIAFDRLHDFVANLDEPFCIPKPNEIKITSFDLPIYENNLIHCVDLLNGLARNCLGSNDSLSNQNAKLQKELDKIICYEFPIKNGYELKQISSTIERKKQDIAARILQRAWKKYKLQLKLKHNKKD